MKRYITITLLAAFILSLFSTVGCIRKPEEEIPDSEKEVDHLVIMEVFYIGSIKVREWRKQNFYYLDDTNPYIKIYNPTKETKYLDGLALATTSFLSTESVMFDVEEQDFTKEYTAVHKVVHFPGSGKEYPILPGETKLITNVAVDHTKDFVVDPEEENVIPGNPSSYDLSIADFEWLTISDIENGAGGGYTDNAEVPNMIKSYIEEGSKDGYFLIDQNRALMLVDFPKENFEGENLKKLERLFEYTWQSTTGDKMPNVDREVHVIPNTSIIDAVIICPTEQFVQYPVSPAIDEGWAAVTSSYLGRNVIREYNHKYLNKAIRRIHDGKKWVDTNNSLIDFTIVDASNNKDYSKVPKDAIPTNPIE